jgi:hypothetical protein
MVTIKTREKTSNSVIKPAEDAGDLTETSVMKSKTSMLSDLNELTFYFYTLC